MEELMEHQKLQGTSCVRPSMRRPLHTQGEERKGLACRLAVASTPERWELVPANYLPVIPLGIFLGYDGVHPL
jgi:hypothetical protein